MRDLYIAIPAWGPGYVELAVRHTIPATLASLTEWDPQAKPTFLIHTDDRAAFSTALAGYPIEFYPLQFGPGHDGQWVAFKAAHKEAIARTPDGALLALLNSDIVVSRECFAVVDRALQGPVKTVVSVGIRTLIDGNTPPIGATAPELARWIWAHRHPITEHCVWGRGRTRHPSIMFFEDGPDALAMRGFHLTPMFIRKDRSLAHFLGTIDDDLLESYRDEEIHFVRNWEEEFAVAELSPGWKTHGDTGALTVDGVLKFGRERFSDSHIRNFTNHITIFGEPRPHPAADAIIAGLRTR